jgi:hypothetical protein
MTGSRRWWREPVLHFIFIAALLVFVQAMTDPSTAQRAIVVSEEVLRGLRADYVRRNGAGPTQQEEMALVEDHVRNEMLYREALALGLDKGDIVVRRRLIQKMEFLLEDDEPLKEPSDEELETYLLANGSRYRTAAKVAISHVFVSSDRHADPRGTALGLSEQIVAGRPPAELGDPFLRGRELPLYGEATLAGIVGSELAAAAMTLPVGQWSAPIPSPYGYHLVLVREHQPSRAVSLSEARRRLLRDWRSDERKRANEKALARLRSAYDVRVDGAGDA